MIAFDKEQVDLGSSGEQKIIQEENATIHHGENVVEASSVPVVEA